MGRPTEIMCPVIISLRLERDLHEAVHEIATIESMRTGKSVSASELIREATRFVYMDNERLRECFRRSRNNSSKRWRYD